MPAVVLEDLAQYLPATLHKPDLTEDEWFEFCSKYRDFRVEYSAEGNLILMSGTDFITGRRNSFINRRLGEWAEMYSQGDTRDSSTAFLLPSGARLSPDASWISNNRLQALSPSNRRIPVMVPEFVIELKSATDSRKDLHEKMAEWIQAGVELGWLIDPERKRVTVYRPNTMPEDFDNLDTIAGSGPVEGFILDLTSVWR